MQSVPPPRAKEMLVTWDFVLVCDDGTWVCLHPNFKDPKIACYTGEGVQDHEIPNTGKGGSSGKGTNKDFKNKHIQATLKFDPKKIDISKYPPYEGANVWWKKNRNKIFPNFDH